MPTRPEVPCEKNIDCAGDDPAWARRMEAIPNAEGVGRLPDGRVRDRAFADAHREFLRRLAAWPG